jgi:hypothetical protein
MNRAKLKNYAPQARRDFIQAVTDRAAFYGLTPKKTEPVIEKGDLALIGGRAFPRSVVQKRRELEDRISRHGFEQVMEAMAYTWFNRFVAIRFMELHGYLDHGYRVLSHPEGKSIPEILEHAEHVELTGLDRSKVIELKLEGTKEEELYRMLLIAQCNALNSAMPFLFEWINDETELLLPNNLLHSDSLVRKLINELDEQDWQEVEIIGWLYESYISEKKDEVIGKVVRSEDIPAATQRFTPNWIVKYLVQNTLGRQWLATYPNSPLRQQMAYYIEPAEQTLKVQTQLKAITPESLNPEEITFLDDACGSGHILVEAYDLFKAIYQERGYRAKDIPELILKKNLYGLEIDDRAAQLACLSLIMKARRDDSRIFINGVRPHVLAIQESGDTKPKDIVAAFSSHTNDIDKAEIEALIELFEKAKTFGSLIQIPPKLEEKLVTIMQAAQTALVQGDLMAQAAIKPFMPIIEQALVLSYRYDVVVANPPYMGSKFFNKQIKDFVASNYKNGKSDLYACFILRNSAFLKLNGFMGMITIPNWMFLPTFEDLRRIITDIQSIESLIHNGRGVFGSDFGTCAFVLHNFSVQKHIGIYRRLFDVPGLVASNEELIGRFFSTGNYLFSMEQIKALPGLPFAYWIDTHLQHAFTIGRPFEDYAKPRQGLATGDNNRFLRMWSEVSFDSIGWNCSSRQDAKMCQKRWFPYSKGGPFRRWYGNNYLIVDWANDGEEIRKFYDDHGNLRSRPQNLDFFFRPALTWSLTSYSQLGFAARFRPPGYIFDINGMSAFPSAHPYLLLGILNSIISVEALKVINPTLAFQAGDIAKIPTLIPLDKDRIEELVTECIEISRDDWDSNEESWDFLRNPLLSDENTGPTIMESFNQWVTLCDKKRKCCLESEREVNKYILETYDMSADVSTRVTDAHVVLHIPEKEKDIRCLISYAIGCMMGRYSLDKPGLIYAHGGNKGFDHNQYETFPADQDGIIPIMEGDWFHGDAGNRVMEFIGVTWPREHLEENLKFIADGLGSNRGEQPRDVIRRYLATGFYKHHLSMYKRRPIYWLFSSGKQRAFQCLVYLHRYNESTLSRMRTEYVIPLQGKIVSRIEQLWNDIQNATSTSHRKKLEKERGTLVKQQAELQAFDEKLRHYADLRISLDLDDGVKVNYGKFGDLLAEIKTVTGGVDE